MPKSQPKVSPLLGCSRLSIQIRNIILHPSDAAFILSQINSVYTFKAEFSKFRFHIILPTTPRSYAFFCLHIFRPKCCKYFSSLCSLHAVINFSSLI
jgi:hypothetical protein